MLKIPIYLYVLKRAATCVRLLHAAALLYCLLCTVLLFSLLSLPTFKTSPSVQLAGISSDNDSGLPAVTNAWP